jgi:hypothetical protein
MDVSETGKTNYAFTGESCDPQKGNNDAPGVLAGWDLVGTAINGKAMNGLRRDYLPPRVLCGDWQLERIKIKYGLRADQGYFRKRVAGGRKSHRQ